MAEQRCCLNASGHADGRRTVLRTVKRWTNETEQVLKTCFDLIDWTVFEAAAIDLDKLTVAVTYISSVRTTLFKSEYCRCPELIFGGRLRSEGFRF